jgi:16S rRNA (guanine966-N2)-methyltransferase
LSLRIVAGRHRGRRLTAPEGLATRPTAERAREALFAVLERGPPPLRGCRFLDLFAGSGTIGLEALSRGAESALLVDQAAAAVRVIGANVAALGEGGRAAVRRADACRLGPAPGTFDIAFLDPPYGSGLLEPALAALLDGAWLAPAARVVAELGAREPFALPPGLLPEDERRYGAARFVFLRHAG